MSSRLPLFPLELVLFPGELVPLHIFEPRYRQLLADCLAGDERFGLTPAVPPGPGARGTVAHIEGTQALPDGRSNIVVRGGDRFTLRALLPEGTPYLVGAVESVGDLPDTAPLPAERARLEELAAEFRTAAAVLADAAPDTTAWDSDPERFSFQVAALLEPDPEVRLPLHTERRTRDRVRGLLELLPGRLASLRIRAAVHARARTNGKGHHGHDIVAQ